MTCNLHNFNFELVLYRLALMMEAKRAIIKSLIEKKLKISQICKEVKKFNINKMLVHRTYKRYVATGDVKIKKKLDVLAQSVLKN